MPLKKYRAKRNFKKSPEPRGKKLKRKPSKLSFVIQEHASKKLHYDFRLELDGVLKSWAVPKGPSLNPTIKRLAVHVDDHPLEYGKFEGVIPDGHYGAGIVTIWDKGEWKCLDENPRKAYQKGHLHFQLIGKKLKGQWNLVQIKKKPDQWLLIKVDDQYAQSKSLTLENYKKSDMPTRIKPQLLTLVDKPPLGEKWIHEIKYDGYRLLFFINKKKIKIMTRNQNNWTNKFNFLVKEFLKLKLSSAIIDGELVAVNEEKQFDFQLLQNSIDEGDTDPLYYFAFDLLYYDGYDLTQFPLSHRKKILQKIISTHDSAIRYSDHIVGNGPDVYKNACQLGLEGIVSKEINSPYVQKRSHYWLKAKCLQSEEFVICGYTKPRGQRKYFGSLVLGVYGKNRQLIYCGHVGTGFSEKTLKLIGEWLKKHETTQIPFKTDFKDVTWVKPKLIAEIEFTGWTRDKVLRQPSFKGLAKNLNVIASEAKQSSGNNSSLDCFASLAMTRTPPNKENFLSNPEKILFPEQKITKSDLAEYYDAIHSWILPHIKNRPLTLVRCPQGIEKKCFYQRHLTEISISSIYTIDIQEKKNHEPFIYIKDREGLLELVQLGVLEIHPWNIHIDKPNNPDVIIFDLDPAPDVEWNEVIQAARFVREQLENIGLISFVKTTGGKGLHITIPIKRLYTWEEIKLFSQAFAKTLAEFKPDIFTSVMTKSKRKGKIFIDYFRNQLGATSVAPYSVRIHPNAPVATPLSWDELSAKIKPNTYTVKNILKRLEKLKSDPWEDFFKLHQTIAIE